MTTRARPLSGLRRLSRPAPEPLSGGVEPTTPTTSPPAESCEMCRVEVGPRHGHVADVDGHRLLCTCRPCYLLFTGHGAGASRYLAVPEEWRRVDDVAISQGQWDSLQFPVDLAFLFRQTGADAFMAYYPGPGGATESLLDLASWDDVMTTNPVLQQVQTDVEAILLRRMKGGVFHTYLVPIDRCYELVGIVRESWSGFSGGAEVWARIDGFFDDLDRRAKTVDRHGGAVARA